VDMILHESAPVEAELRRAGGVVDSGRRTLEPIRQAARPATTQRSERKPGSSRCTALS
jgi:hypothetical protein